MTYQTINIIRVMKIKILITISVSCMAHGTKVLVAVYTNTKIIYNIFFTQIINAPAGNRVFFLPPPMFRFHYFRIPSVMTTQAGGRYLRRTIEMFLQNCELGMIGYRNLMIYLYISNIVIIRIFITINNPYQIKNNNPGNEQNQYNFTYFFHMLVFLYENLVKFSFSFHILS